MTTTTTEVALRDEMSVPELVGQVATIQQAMTSVMKDGEHFGVIPGVQKPSLWKPGAEKLCLLFRLAPRYTTEKEFGEGGHLTVTAECDLTHITTAAFCGSGQGMASTHESKYAYRKGSHGCPVCGESAIIKGKPEYGGGWLCWRKQGGCGSTWPDDSPEGLNFAKPVERVPNEDLPDLWNTILKMATKRALVAAVLNVTAASDIFTQDIEDLPSSAVVGGRPINTQTGEVLEEKAEDIPPVPFESDVATPDIEYEVPQGEPVPDEGDFEPNVDEEDVPFESTAKPPIADDEGVGQEARVALLRATIAAAKGRGVKIDADTLVQIALQKADDGRSVFRGFNGASLEDFNEPQTKKALEWVNRAQNESLR